MGTHLMKHTKSQQHFAQLANTLVEHRARLDIYSDPSKHRKAGIICTIGPGTASVEKITELRKAGMNIARLNFSHGSHEYHAQVISLVRESVETFPEASRIVGIALDTKGPEVRTGLVKDDTPIHFSVGDEVEMTTDEAFKEECTKERVFVDYANLPKVVKVGGVVYVDDGLLEFSVLSIDDTSIRVKCVNAGELSSRKGVNLPEVDVDLPALSEKDKSDLQFGVEQGVDMIFASFIRKAADVLEIREFLGEEGKDIKIISKIENHEGLRNFDEILSVTDGVMVARGDLGIEILPEKVFIAQKMIISKCNLAGKPVICATQMLESMIKNPRPTRAEVSDVANAVLDGADCVMLSGETAKGKYPKEAVEIMSQICQEAESAMFQKRVASDMMKALPGKLNNSEPVAMALVTAAGAHNCQAIICMTKSGNSGRLLSKFRPRCPIIVVSRNAQTCRQMHLFRGCYPIHCPLDRVEPREEDIQLRHDFGLEEAKKHGLIQEGGTVLLAHGSVSGDAAHRPLTDFRIARV